MSSTSASPGDPELLTPARVRALLDTHGVRPSRALGQNFVVDANTVRRIARLSRIGPGDHVVEIGAGLGSLTLALVATGARVTAIEIDRHMLPILAETVGDRAEIVAGDVRAVDWGAVLDGPATVVANLPYNIATPLIADLLDDEPRLTRMVVMVQREVGERLAAAAGDDAYGAVSVKVAFWATATVVGLVPPSVFHPRPKVGSALVEIVRRPEPFDPVVDTQVLFDLVRTAFGQRRKMLRRSLAERVTPEAFAAAAIAPEARPEELAVDAWCRLARAVERR